MTPYLRIAPYLWITIGSALGGLFRYSLTRWTMTVSSGFPWGTILINVLGSFVIGFFGTFTLPGTRYAVSENTRLFVTVGLCGGFTTFSSFSLQTYDLMRGGAWARATLNVLLSVVLCLVSVALGHHLAQRTTGRGNQRGNQTGVSTYAIAETAEEEFTG